MERFSIVELSHLATSHKSCIDQLSLHIFIVQQYHSFGTHAKCEITKSYCHIWLIDTLLVVALLLQESLA